jgi:flagellar biosynthetic protein FliP
MTSFTRILIVLGLLRTAIGTPSSPPNQILVGLSLFLTFFVMSPVLERVHAEAYKPFSENRINAEQALERGVAPFKEFMLKQTPRGRFGAVCQAGQCAAHGRAGAGEPAHLAAVFCHQ